VHGRKFRLPRSDGFIASYEFVNLIDVKSADSSEQFLPAAAALRVRLGAPVLKTARGCERLTATKIAKNVALSS
jgi:hypothetical protein